MVLAAGAGERLGGLPKALILVHGRTLLERLVEALTEAGAGEIVLVLGHYAGRVRSVITERAGQRIVNVAAGEQADSLRAGLTALRPGVNPVMVCLTDQPLIDAGALAAVHAAYAQRPAGTDMLVPWVNDAPGNPVMMSRAVVEALLAPGPALTGKAWREHHRQRVTRWDSDNPAYSTDLDSPADLERLRDAGWHIELPAGTMPI